MSRYDFKTMRDQLESGGAVRVVTAPQLFPTPPAIAARAVELLELDSWNGEARETLRVLEPSAGTGNLIEALRADREGASITAYEINAQLCQGLRAKFPAEVHVYQADFLAIVPPRTDAELFDAVLMNPPFSKGDWKNHLRHAFRFLKPGGRLVAVMPAAPSLQAVMRGLCGDGTIEPLPVNSFTGTGVNTCLIRLDKEVAD